jgi:hypothetical protein
LAGGVLARVPRYPFLGNRRQSLRLDQLKFVYAEVLPNEQSCGQFC